MKQRTETMIQRIPENGQDLKVGAAGDGVDPGIHADSKGKKKK